MPVVTIGAEQVHVDDEGFLTEYDEWDEGLGVQLAAAIGIEKTEPRWQAILRPFVASPPLPGFRSRSFSRSSPRSRPRRWPTSRACLSPAAACEF